MRGGGAWAEESAQFAECPDQGHLWSTTRQESRGPEGGARKQRGGRRLPGNKQQLEKGGGRARDSVAHHSEGEDERARALMRSSLNLKKSGKRGLLSQTVGIKDESGLRGAGRAQGKLIQKAFIPHSLQLGSQGWENGKLRDKGRTW